MMTPKPWTPRATLVHLVEARTKTSARVVASRALAITRARAKASQEWAAMQPATIADQNSICSAIARTLNLRRAVAKGNIPIMERDRLRTQVTGLSSPTKMSTSLWGRGHLINNHHFGSLHSTSKCHLVNPHITSSLSSTSTTSSNNKWAGNKIRARTTNTNWWAASWTPTLPWLWEPAPKC